MKGAINIGGVKDISESPLRVLSGPPKCELIGEKDITYNFDIFYTFDSKTGTLSLKLNNIFPASGIDEVNPPKPYPYAKWVLDTTYTGILAVTGTTPTKFGMAQIIDFNSRLNIGHAADFVAEFLIANSYSHVVLTQDGSPDRAARFYSNWFIDNQAGFFDFNGPDLDTVALVDFGAAGVRTQRTILPEQLNHCDSYFNPYFFLNGSWNSFLSSFSQMPVSPLRFAVAERNLYPNTAPDGTKIGTLQFRFRRTATLPLFTYSTAPPLAVAFNNRTFFNQSLGLTWDWDFGDGSAHSTAQNPTHNYPATGTYHVILRATDPVETKAFDQLVNFPLKADFSYTGFPLVSGGVPVREVHFANLSLGNITNDWDFGDGSAHSSLAAPVHEYPRGQSFNVTLTVGDGSGKTNTVTKPVVT